MNFRNISSWAIRNPIPPIVLFVALLLAGIVSFIQMDVNDSPDVEFPFVNVSISQPGAAPTELETQVTQRVEAAVRGVNGVEEINSSVREGNSNTFIQFAIGTPVDRATNDVRDAVSQIRGDLPDGILEPQVVRAEGGSELGIFAVETSDMTLEQLSWYVDNDVSKKLLAIPGMSAVDRYGGVNREIRVILNPAAIQAQGITTAQVNQHLRQINLDSAGGRAEIAGAEQSVRVLGNSQNAYTLGQTQISLGGGRTVRLSDIANVHDGFAEQRSRAKFNLNQVIAFDINRAKILFQSMQFCCSRNRCNPRFLGKHPRKRNLCGSCFFLRGELSNQINQRLIRFASLRRKARDRVAKISTVELCVFVNFYSEKSFAERAERNEAYS